MHDLLQEANHLALELRIALKVLWEEGMVAVHRTPCSSCPKASPLRSREEAGAPGFACGGRPLIFFPRAPGRTPVGPGNLQVEGSLIGWPPLRARASPRALRGADLPGTPTDRSPCPPECPRSPPRGCEAVPWHPGPSLPLPRLVRQLPPGSAWTPSAATHSGRGWWLLCG